MSPSSKFKEKSGLIKLFKVVGSVILEMLPQLEMRICLMDFIYKSPMILQELFLFAIRFVI